MTMVAKVEVFDPCHDRHLLRMEYVGTLFVFRGLLEGEAALVTLVDAVVVTQFPMPLLEKGPNTKVLYHTPHTWNDFFKLVDVCSGLGGISHGALFVGVQTVVANDYNSKMLELHKAHSGADVVLGDVGCPQIVAELFQRSNHAALLSAGYSCQPFSQLGDKRGGSDPRSQSLPKALRAAMWMQSRIVILECVVPARNDPFVAQVLNQFLSLTGFRKEVVNVDLAMIWPCRRNRAWWILHDPSLGAIGLNEWLKVEDLPMIQCLIPYICKWDPRDELALCLDSRECQAFGVTDGSYPKYMMKSQGVAPTALHAWGSQLRACPCGCRDFALSAQRLQEKGLFGLLVASSSECLAQQPIRHVHPSEALALNGMDPTIDFGLDVRLTLSGVGQIASPLQAAWIFGLVIARIEELSKDSVSFSPMSHLLAFRSWLVMKCQEAWPCTENVLGDSQLGAMVGFWKPIKGLSLEQVVHSSFCHEGCFDHISVAAVLDKLIRQANSTQVPAAVDEKETPWFEQPICDPSCDASFTVGTTEITFVDAQGCSG